jgi:hypothetical protein
MMTAIELLLSEFLAGIFVLDKGFIEIFDVRADNGGSFFESEISAYNLLLDDYNGAGGKFGVKPRESCTLTFPTRECLGSVFIDTSNEAEGILSGERNFSLLEKEEFANSWDVSIGIVFFSKAGNSEYSLDWAAAERLQAKEGNGWQRSNGEYQEIQLCQSRKHHRLPGFQRNIFLG